MTKGTSDFAGFTAPENAPGQAFSRVRKAEIDGLLVGGEAPAWADQYYALLEAQADREEGQRWDWRKCLLVAWLALPATKRWPKTRQEFADFLGVNVRTMRQWTLDDAALLSAVRDLRVALVGAQVSELLQAAIDCALEDGPAGHQDRKMLLEIADVYRPRLRTALTGETGAPPVRVQVLELSDEELLSIASSGGAGDS